jgi:threonine dehydrogenase-like Zn-dependent dehydrogenase
MRALVKEGKTVGIKDIPRPVLKSAGDVLVCIKLAGLCRTDVFVAEGKIGSKDTVVLGHEFSGEVVEAGSAANDFARGDRVTVMPVMPCGACAFCKGSAADKCQNTTMLGIDHDGAFAEYVSVPASSVYKLPESVSFMQGAYSEPVAAALSVVKAGIRPEQKGLIHGDNRFGRLIERILRAYGFNDITVHGTGALPENAFDFAVETQATAEIMDEIFFAMKPGGRIVLKSRKQESVGINFMTAVRKELVLTAVNYGDFKEAIRLMADGALKVDDLFGSVHPLEEFPAVF